MSIDIKERYKLILTEHRYCSDFRLKIMQIWGLIYAALATLFVWVRSVSPELSVGVPFLAAGATMLMWIADLRNAFGLKTLRRIGVKIEEEAKIPDNQRFFSAIVSNSFKILTHSVVITIFSVVMFLGLLKLGFLLRDSNGILPGENIIKEYKVVEFKATKNKLEDYLNKEARQGWDLKTIFSDSNMKVVDLIFGRHK